MIDTQVRNCPTCNATHGWWNKVTSRSMVFHEYNGEVSERRIYEGRLKFCAKCDTNITHCVIPKKP